MSDDREACEACGMTYARCACAPERPARPGLQLLPPVAAGDAGSARVRLLREVKGPTVDDLVAGGEPLDLLPGRLTGVVAALERGDLPLAADVLDATLASVHRGPGYRRRGPRRTGFVVGAAVLLLLSLLAALLALARFT